MKGFLKFIGILLLIVVLVVAAVGVVGIVTLNKASAEVEHAEYGSEKPALVKAMIDTVFGNEIVFTEDNINQLIEPVQAGLATEQFNVSELFVKLNGDKGTVHADVNLTTGYKIIDRTYHISADFAVKFENNYATATISNISCGSITLGEGILELAEKFISLPEIVRISGGNVVITYDCTQLDALVEGYLIQKLNDPIFLNTLGTYRKLFEAIPAEDIPNVINIVVHNIELSDSAIRITADVIDANNLLKTVGTAALSLFAGGNN